MNVNNTNTKKKIAVLGASGYTGADAVRLLARHPEVEISALTANTHATGANIHPKICCRLRWTRPRSAFTSATSARNEINMDAKERARIQAELIAARDRQAVASQGAVTQARDGGAAAK